ncbi:MAG: AAA family ATPase [Desulfobacteraceae bacterium]|nr:AAA family ATPase [Desulfobacteraceae bacterium]
MRILTIALTNINSLKGQFLIDFDRFIPGKAGVFAITGPTGAGKTSILDGLCAALYGRTPRLPRAGEMEELMTHHTGECASEVTFTVNGKQYRSWYGRHRARKKPDGAMQSPNMELTDVDTGTIIASKSKVPKAVEDLTGLDFDRFCRSMLLAQGNFAAFLKASDDERAVLLEKITGTRIYSLISQKCFERNKEEELKIAVIRQTLAGFNLLSGEEIDGIRERIEQKNGEISLAEQESKALLKQKQFLMDVAACRETALKCGKDLEQLAQDEKQAAPDLERLQLARRASPFSAAHATLAGARGNCNALEKKILTDKEAVPRINGEFNNLKARHGQDAKRVDTLAKDVETRLALFGEIGGLLPLIRERARELGSEEARLAGKATEKKSTLTRLKTAERTARECRNTVAGLTEALKKRVAEKEKIASDLAKGFGKEDETTLEASLRRLETRKRLLEKQKERTKEAFERSQKIASLTASVKDCREKLDQVSKMEGPLVDREEELTKSLTDLRAAREIERQILSLEEKRKELVPDAPCPLCGSTHHPFAEEVPETGVTAKAIAETEAGLARLNREKQALAVQRAALLNTIRNHDERIAEEAAGEGRARNEAVILAGQTGISLPVSQWQALERHEAEAGQAVVLTGETLNSLKKLNRAMVQADKLIQKEEKARGRAELNAVNALATAEKFKEKAAGLETEITEITAVLTKKRNNLAALMDQCGKKAREAGLETASMVDQPHVVEKELNGLKERLKKQLLQGQQGLAELEKAITRTEARLQGTQAGIAASENELKAAREHAGTLEEGFNSKIQAAGFAHGNDFMKASLSQQELDRLETLARALNDKRVKLEALARDNEARFEALVENPETDETMEALKDKEAALTKNVTELTRLKHGDEFRLEENRKRCDEHGETLEQEERQRAETRRWNGLNQLIGQQDGGKFRKFAQGLTLDRLTRKANTYLAMLSQRYRLKRSREHDLGITVIDTCFGDRIRPTENLSGGESFLVSLSLALGLSDLTSRRTSIESLFLDEGFGTLDTETLETALAALDTLNASGKTVGIISHVEALKERIAAKIDVVPVSGGTSTVKVVNQ